MNHNNSWFVIINPKAGNGKAKTKWPKIEMLLKQYKFSFEFAFTDFKSHSTELVKNAINKGFEKIICVGGDGTIHHVVNGIMLQNRCESSSITLGVIAIGTGNDWVKTYNIPKAIEKAIQIIKNEKTCFQDVGKINFTDSKNPSVYFNNLAGIGFDGYVAKTAESLKYFGKFAYLIATLKSFFFYKNIKVTIKLKDKICDLNALMVIVGLCEFSGGGMRLTNKPIVNDGLFDISVLKDFTKWDIIKQINKLYSGKIGSIKKVKVFKVNSLKIKPKKNKFCFIQADGEVFSSETIEISLYKKAIKLCYNSL